MSKQSMKTVLWYIIVVVIFGISAIAIIINGRDFERVLYYYPHFMTGDVVGEHRYIPRRQNLSDRVEEYLHEYLLGPQSITSRNVFLPSLRIESLFVLDNNTLVVNYSASLAQTAPNALLPPSQVVEIVDSALRQNFPRIQEVRFLIEGQEI